jgi:AcrR family transcriptional regulator
MNAPKSSVIAGRELPVADPAANLHPTALRILEAAKYLLTTRGFHALTLESIAAEAGVNKAATRYYFGSKAGLVAAIVDEIVLHECAAVASDLPEGLPFDQRVERFIASIGRMAADEDSFSGFFDILPHAVRDRHLRSRLVYLYELWYEWNLEWLDIDGGEHPGMEEQLRGIGQLCAAICDGIAVQSMIHGRQYDAKPALDAMRTALLASRDALLGVGAVQTPTAGLPAGDLPEATPPAAAD